MQTPKKSLKTWDDLSLEEKKKAYYYWHIQRAGDLTEVAEELETTTEILARWAVKHRLPVLEYDPTAPASERHTKLFSSQAFRVQRLSRQNMYMGVAKLVAARSTCLSCQVGAVIVKDNRIVSTGYNGAPSGCYHCTDVGVCRKELYGHEHFDSSVPGQLGAAYEVSRSVHAEQSAICQAAKVGIAIGGADIFVTREPCAICMRMIINCGIEKVYYPPREDSNQISQKTASEEMV